MEKKINQKKLMKWFGMFFGAMFLFTLLSRAADSANVAKIEVKTPQNQLIVHKVTGTGKVEGIRQRAVFAQEGLRVSEILVQEGQSVKKGEILLRLSMNSIEQSIEALTLETEQLQRRIRDLNSKAKVEETSRQLEQSRAQQDKNIAASSQSAAIENAQNELNIARDKLAKFYEDQGFTAGEEDAEADSREEALKEDIRIKQAALNSAIESYNKEVQQAQRSIEDSYMPQATDASLEDTTAELETKKKSLEKLNKLKKRKGAVKSPIQGVVKNIAVSVGGMTSQEGAVILYDTRGALRMEGTVFKDALKYVKSGGVASLTGSSKKTVDGAVIQNIRQDETDSGQYIISIQIPEDSFSIGETVEFEVKQEEGPYTCCIPMTALFEENGQAYVYVVDSENSVLGEVLVARRMAVTVKDKNEQRAALEGGSLSSNQQVIINSDREIRDGTRVRFKEGAV